MQLLPPSPNKCQYCAVKHGPEQPHNAQSFFYAFWFNATYGRSPTWNDAIAHCSEEVKGQWLAYLAKLGIDPNSTNLKGNIKAQSDVKHLLAD